MRSIDELSTKSFQNNPQEQLNSVGEKAAIRFFNTDDHEDMSRLRRIITGSGTQRWMDEVADLSDEDLRTWAREKGGWRKSNSFLFAVVPSAGQPHAGEVAGFIYMYGGKDERSQALRLIKKGMLPPEAAQGKVYETSSAVLPNAEGLQENSGFMASARRQAIQEVDRISNHNRIKDVIYRALDGADDEQFQTLIANLQREDSERVKPNTFVYCFIDPSNVNSLRAAGSAGFVDVGETTYDPKDEDNPDATKDRVLILDWTQSQKKLTEKSYHTFFSQREEKPEYTI